MSMGSGVLAGKSPAARLRRTNKRKRKRKPSAGAGASGRAARTAALSPTDPPRRTTTGADIRAKIAANRAKRLASAEAMKREAGVTEHTVHENKEDLSGLAYIGTGRILSPEGRKIVQLYTLAHECGHIFLHNSGEGYWLPGHVKELEAESYAHQAFREHGMILPRRLSHGGRRYVGSWVEKDRTAGIPIDPRAVAYAAGRRSPYEPLRMVPPTWTIFCSETEASKSRVRRSVARVRRRLLSAARRRLAWLSIPQSLADEARAVMGLAARWALYGYTMCTIGVGVLRNFDPDLIPRPPHEYNLTLPELGIAALGGLLIANLAVLVRTVFRVR